MEKLVLDPEEKSQHLAHYQTSLRRETIHRIIEREQLSELEAGQTPVYTQYVSSLELLHNIGF